VRVVDGLAELLETRERGWREEEACVFILSQARLVWIFIGEIEKRTHSLSLCLSLYQIFKKKKSLNQSSSNINLLIKI